VPACVLKLRDSKSFLYPSLREPKRIDAVPFLVQAECYPVRTSTASVLLCVLPHKAAPRTLTKPLAFAKSSSHAIRLKVKLLRRKNWMYSRDRWVPVGMRCVSPLVLGWVLLILPRESLHANDRSDFPAARMSWSERSCSPSREIPGVALDHRGGTWESSGPPPRCLSEPGEESHRAAAGGREYHEIHGNRGRRRFRSMSGIPSGLPSFSLCRSPMLT
jgi:hypothetical protein